jgi:transposase-like protein
VNSAPVYLTASDVARALDVNPSALSNWTARGTGPLPEPAAYAGRRPLWTVEQVRALLDARYADASAYLNTLESGERCTR